MRKHRRFVTLVIGALSLLPIVLSAQNSLPRGEDVIDHPAVGEGLSLHNLFQSNMVLQRDKPIRIRGWATAGEKVTVSFADQEQTAKAGDDRSWQVEFPALPASSESRELRVKGNDKTLVLENILIGDVWLLSGQSNMEHPLSRVEDGDLEIAAANFPEIRILTVPAANGPEEKRDFPRIHEWSGWFSRHFRKGDWDVCNPEIVRELSAIGFVFARRIHHVTQVPIGIIDVSRGGTTVESWTPDSVLREIGTPEVDAWLTQWDEKVAAFDAKKDLEERVRKHHEWEANMKKQEREIPKNRTVPTDLRPGPAMDQNRPGNCYASMVAPIAGFPVKGAIWHQGFNNALQDNGHVMYASIFPKMIEAWRKAFDDPKMPFGIISLCTAGAPQTLDNYVESMANEGVYIRAVQYETFRKMAEAGDEKIGFASSYDMRRSWYHPGLKVPVGERIARWALATEYEQKIPWKPPVLEEMKVEDGRIVLTFNVQVNGLRDWPIEGFAIAGEDRRFQPARAEHLETGKDDRNRPKLDRHTLVLTSPLVSQPIHFRYAWGRNPMANVTINDARYGRAPLPTLRSDDWKVSEIPVELGEEMQHRQKMGQLRKMLKEDDLKRRLFEARALIDQQNEADSGQ